jgi:hypothetical protein
MDRRCVSVWAIVVLLVLTLVHSGAASTSRKSSLKKRATAIARSRPASTQSRKLRAPAARASRGCAPCAAKVAKKKKGRSAARTAKNLPCHPKNYVDPKIAKNYNAAMRDLRRAGIRPRVTSVWRSSASQAQLHRCSLSTRCRRSNPGLYFALPAGKSIHEAGFAVDIAGVATGPRGAKRLTAQGRRIVAIMKKNGFSWRYGLADPVHFEIDPRKHGYRSVREAIRRTQTTCQVKLAKGKPGRKRIHRIAASPTKLPARARLSAQGRSTKTSRAAAKAGA